MVRSIIAFFEEEPVETAPETSPMYPMAVGAPV
jgi:hypothetical protein